MSNKSWEGNNYEARCCMVSRMQWHLPAQEEADWLRLFLLENKIEILQRELQECIQQTLFVSIPSHQ